MGWIIVGLGNPGSQYAGNRHNIGFMVADRLADKIGGGYREKFRAHFCRGTLAGKDVLVLKPMTFMNLSGTSVGEAATFFKTPVQEVIVIHDELDLAYDQVQVKIGGGHAGHNGLRSIFEHFGKDFVRDRVGIGRPKFGDVTGHVLGNFSSDEQAGLSLVIDKAAAAIELILQKGALAAQNATNQKPKSPKPPKAPPPADPTAAPEAGTQKAKPAEPPDPKAL
jgi:PTH1 family peptidyl-tRNA hydrolase